MPATDASETVVIVNPNSGDADHADAVRHRTELLGYDYRETEAAEDTVTFAREAAADGADTVVAVGGDGTVNEVVRGLDEADALDSVTLGVVPAGTGNSFAGNIGVESIDHAFDVVEDGRRRRIDLGRADDSVFVNSCVAGLTAEASADASSDMKSQLGVLAYVVSTVRSVSEFDALPLAVDAYGDGGETTAWEGEALMVLVGNARRFVRGDDTQAAVEDGEFEVTVVEDVSTLDVMGEAVTSGLFAADSEYVQRFRAPALELTLRESESVRFSLDGEMLSRSSLSVRTDPGALEVAVGDGYDPDPGGL
ncbi:diacylglycerol/lipid kinase family protein [Halobacterium jilantaiense]|uniref:Lipid kinase, YegS/Rv2252/BmrU family n=1 Tax=Halobacterium jilantaiense TaxID=355548 RepID=A0A1I0MLB6_9EURY|nr:YegS/Rv2252/BmrU family lipid kinase [Halobacterium jilantaiense]SEV88865.1 lipid kinase, YegS/Rv2252/BmrU family [Halobacterium jilantaiense]